MPKIRSVSQAGIAQLVEHNLAKVGVASSSLVSRSILEIMAGWQSGHAADCNSVYAGSIPTPASIFLAIVHPTFQSIAKHLLYTYPLKNF